jgi:molybdate transport system substrate-binding protein
MSRNVRSSPFAFVALSWLLLCIGCGGAREDLAPSPAPAPATLLVAAASDLQAALPSLTSRFEKGHPGVSVKVSVGSSGQLSQQIRQGATFDLFLAANESYVRDLAKEGIIDSGSVRPYAQGSLVLVVYREAGVDVAGLDDLKKPEIKHIALANPAFAPYGKAGKQALERAGLWDELQPKVVQAETVRQALQFVQSGNAEAGLVGRAIADVPEARSVPIDPGLYDPIIQGLGIVSETPKPALARDFAEFVLGDEGQAILKGFGFQPPPPADSSTPGAEGRP